MTVPAESVQPPQTEPPAGTRFIVATANPDKLVEIRGVLSQVLTGVSFEARPAELPEVEETGDTLELNARLKARAVCDATGLPAVADDTGLEVEALGGAPGVRTSRYAGEHATYADNVEKLLREMSDVPEGQRRARFVTIALARFPDGREVIARGEVEGTISREARGTDGFGYDPVFVPAGSGRTLAEMAPGDKHAISHRGRAMRALAAALGDDVVAGRTSR